MKAIQFALTSLLVVLFPATASLAQVQRTFVSGLGSDGNPCTRTAPCRTFGQAISQTNAGGEVVVLDSAGYGSVIITKAVSLIAPPGVYAGISVFSGDGIDINAGPSDTVILRGLTVNNQGSSGNGIVCTTAGTLHVESCIVNGFSIASGLTFTGSGNLEVKYSIFRGNSVGISVQASAALVAIDHVRLEGEGGGIAGLMASDNSHVTVTNSLASGNHVGFVAVANSAPLDIALEGCIATNNIRGVRSTSNGAAAAVVRVSDCTITDNITGLQNDGAPALLLSRGNNTVEGNGSNTSGTIGSYTAK